MLAELLSHFPDGAAEFRIGRCQTHAVEDEPDSRRLNALENVGHGTQLRTRGHAGLDHDDGAVSGLDQPLRFFRISERRGVDENDFLLNAFRPIRTFRGIRNHHRSSHGLQQLFQTSCDCCDADFRTSASQDTTPEAAVSETEIDSGGQPQKMFFGDFICDFGKVGQLRHGRKTQKLLDIGSDINPRVRSVRDHRDRASQKHETEKEHEGIADDAGIGGIPGNDSGGGQARKSGTVSDVDGALELTAYKGISARKSGGYVRSPKFKQWAEYSHRLER